jgi:hypothetical protein
MFKIIICSRRKKNTQFSDSITQLVRQFQDTATGPYPEPMNQVHHLPLYLCFIFNLLSLFW